MPFVDYRGLLDLDLGVRAEDEVAHSTLAGRINAPDSQ
jgi:hypothetical protein